MTWIAKTGLFLLLMGHCLFVKGQTGVSKDSTTVNADSVYADVDKKPEYPGGEALRIAFVEKAINLYVPVDNGTPNGTYTVIIACILDETGKIMAMAPETNIGYGMEKEVMRVLKKLPKAYSPAIKNGMPVKYKLRFPFHFSVSN